MTADVGKKKKKKPFLFFFCLPERTGECYPQGLLQREDPFTPALLALVFNTCERMLRETMAMAKELLSSRLEMSLLSRRGHGAGPGTLCLAPGLRTACPCRRALCLCQLQPWRSCFALTPGEAAAAAPSRACWPRADLWKRRGWQLLPAPSRLLMRATGLQQSHGL